MATTSTTIEEISLEVSNASKADEVNDGVEAFNTPAQHGQELELEQPDIEQSPHDSPTEYPTGAKLWLMLVPLGAILALGGLDVNIVATAVPSITDHFHTFADVGWYVAAFRLCSCAFQFAFGKMYKLFSMKKVFLAANAIFLFGSLLCATAVTSPMFVVGRAVTGVGWAGLLGGCLTILAHIVPLRRRPFFIGLLCGVEGTAIICAPILGGLLTQFIGWRWCFWINLPFGGATLLMTMFLLSDPKRSSSEMSLMQKLEQLDLVSNLLFIPALTSLFIALSWAGTKYPWDDGRVIGLLVTFAVLVVGFAYNQHRRGDDAALPPRILKNRTVLAASLFTLCTNSATQVLEYYLPTYYQVVRGWPPSKSGYMMVPFVVGGTIGLLGGGTGISTVGYYTPFMLFASTAMPIFSGLITTLGVDTSLARIISYTGAFGFAYGFGFNGPTSAVQTVLPLEDASVGLAVILFSQNFGPAVFNVIAQVILSYQLRTHLSGLIPGLDPLSIEDNGLTDIAKMAAPVLREEILTQVDLSLHQTWYLVVALTCVTMIGSVFTEWRSVKRKQS